MEELLRRLWASFGAKMFHVVLHAKHVVGDELLSAFCTSQGKFQKYYFQIDVSELGSFEDLLAAR